MHVMNDVYKQPILLKLLIIPLASLLVLAACERGPVGIFASIEREVAIQEGNLLKNAAVNGMVEADNGNGTAYYFAAVGGRIRYRRADGDESDWSSISNPSAYRTNHSRPTSIVKLNGTVYVSFVEGERKRSGLFTLEPATRSYNAQGSISSDNHVARLFALGNELFASIQFKEEGEDAEFELWHLGEAGSASLPGAPISGLQERPFISAATDETNYWFITSDAIFHTGTAVDEVAPVDKPAAIGTSLGGVFFHGGDLYLSSRDGRTARGGSTGYISVSDALPTPGGSWLAPVTESDRAFTDFAYAADIDAFADGVLFIGTYRTLSGRSVVSPGGYMEIPGAAFDSPQRPDGNSYQASELSKSAVMQIFVPSQGNTIFALTGGRGLWRGDYDSDGVATWVWE
ncbi:MAG: hypothetical protein EA404_08860 [Spirochaetaceae bacterium]|nr:MAG: hypothetical protein EA404_08860 [Spirochaetaceae bacterium]